MSDKTQANLWSYITLTEACQDAEEEICMHEAYDFKEVF